jgi:hypothetical protein
MTEFLSNSIDTSLCSIVALLRVLSQQVLLTSLSPGSYMLYRSHSDNAWFISAICVLTFIQEMMQRMF